MGKSADSPAAPDYMALAEKQGQISKENLNTQNYANRANQSNPWGDVSWSSKSVIDPSTGQPVTQWTQNTSLAPGLKSALDAQIGLQGDRSQLAASMLGRVQNAYANPVDTASLPAFTMANAPQNLGTNVTDYSRGLNTGFNVANVPQYDSSYRDQVATQLMQKLQPTQDYQTRSLETKLSNQGLRPGSEAYNRAMGQLQNAQSNERYNAYAQAGDEASRLYNMQMGSAQQTYNQNQGLANFNNAALNQASALDIARMNAQNQALSQQYGLNNTQAANQNALRQNMLAEQLQLRGLPLSEMNALLNGQSVSNPTMNNYNTAGLAATPNYMGAAQNSYDAQLGAANASNAANNQLWSTAGTLAAAYMFSDRRLKSNIKRVGTHEIGVGIYEYTMMGMPQRGVIAQEVEAVRPDLVKRHANGFLMVNYASL